MSLERIGISFSQNGISYGAQARPSSHKSFYIAGSADDVALLFTDDVAQYIGWYTTLYRAPKVPYTNTYSYRPIMYCLIQTLIHAASHLGPQPIQA